CAGNESGTVTPISAPHPGDAAKPPSRKDPSGTLFARGAARPPTTCARADADPRRLADDRLDGKPRAAYELDLSRGDLSRPACSHVKQVAKRPGTRSDPAENHPAGFFVARKEGLMDASTERRYRPETRLIHAG